MNPDGYMSPISLTVERIVQDFNNHTDQSVLHAVMKCGINVDRDELIKALSYDRNQYRKGFNDGIEFAHTWISVMDRLPKTNDLVLCVGSQGGMFIGCILLDNTVSSSETYHFHVPNARHGRCATHWMPLPKAPEEE